MDSQSEGFTEKFLAAYPSVSISVKENGSSNVKQTVDKQSPIKTPQKTVIGQKASVAVSVKSPAVVKTVTNSPKTPVTNLNMKQAANLAPKINTPNQVKAAAVAKLQTVVKAPVGPRPTAQVITKGNVVTPAPPLKTSVPIHQVVKSDSAVVKSAVVKTSAPSLAMKANSQKVTPSKVVQNPIKAPGKSQVAKEDAPDQSTTKVVYHMPQPAQRANNQLTIEKIDQQQRIPVVLDSNQVVVRSGQALVLQNPQLQSVVIGTSSIPASAVVGPQQVTQQVTLYGPKGQSFAVDDVKKQINLNKQSLSSTMTNVVSSTTNPVPVRTQEGVQSAVRVSNKVSAVVRGLQKQTQAASQQSIVGAVQYSSTRGQIKKVSPKREIPMQKVSPLPPPVPQPDMILANEEEVTTSEEIPTQQPPPIENLQLIVILPNGLKREISVPNNTLNVTLNELIGSITPVPPDMTASIMAVTAEQEAFLSTDCDSENPSGEPGEILGIQDEMEAGEMNGGATEQNMEEDSSTKEMFPSKMEPLYKEGLLAVCHFCGYTSIDFNQCQRCNRKIPQNCKTVTSDFTQSAVSKGRKTKADSLSGGSPKKKRVCRKKKLEEPVCLTISDDEELLGLSHHHQISEESFHSDSNSQMSSCDKEPIITDEMVSELKQSISGGEFIGGGLDVDHILDNSTPDMKTTLQCRTVRIGSYKVVPKDKVLITSNGIKVTVPMVGSSQIVDIKILHHEIIKVLTHFGRGCPVLFLYTRPAAAARIRKTLQMRDKNGYYYDCMSSDETHRRITFLPDKIDEDCKATMKEIYKYPENLFAELTGKEANDILVKASPKEVQKFLNKKQPAPVQPQLPFNGQNIQTIMVYPPPPEKGGIPINTEDYACLDCDQFLNDVIIDFYLKYVVEKTLSPEDRARTHVFSSFFYKRLTTKPPPKRKSMNPVENDPSASPAVKRHSRVKSWTKNVNLFTKDFIIIPINENSHWFLAIVCFPGLIGPVKFSDNTPIDLPGRKKKKIEDMVSISGKETVTIIGSTTITAVAPSQGVAPVELGDEVEDRDEADGEDEHMDVPDEEEDPMLKVVPEVKEELDEEEIKPKKKEREPIKQPCILIFDSLAGASRSRVVATLRDYLRVEYEAKHGETRDFSGEVLKGTNVRCPQQTNYTDCGLYVLQYVEAFFKWPITDYHIPILQVQDWFQADIVTRKRYDIQQLLLHLMEEQRIDIETLGLPVLNLSPDMGTRYMSEDDDEDDDEHIGDEEEDEDEMLGEDGEYNEEMDHENVMEDGEIGIGHHEDEEDYLDPAMEHEDHEIDDEDYEEQLCEEEEDEEQGIEELEDDKMTEVSLSQLKKYRIPRLSEKDRLTDNTYKEA